LEQIENIIATARMKKLQFLQTTLLNSVARNYCTWWRNWCSE